MRRDWTGLLIPGSIAIVFFYLYSVSHFKGFNSDNAIHVLMASDFVFPHDLYYWGQDRLGSFLPMIASVLVFASIPPLIAVSIAQILFLGGSTWLLGKNLINKKNLPPLAILLFLPPSAFTVAVQAGHPYIAHLFFLSLFLFVVLKDMLTMDQKAFLLPVIAFLMLWSSEIAIANFLAVLIFLPAVWKEYYSLKRLLYALIGSATGLGWLVTAKYFAARENNTYMTIFASPEDIGKAFTEIIQSLYEAAIWKSGFLPDSITLYAIVLTIGWIIYKKYTMSALSLYLIWSSLFSFLLVLFSHWSSLMDFPVRYYTPAYLQLVLALVFILDRKSTSRIFPLILTGILGLASALNGYLHLRKYSYEVDERLSAQEARTLAKTGNFGVIGSYWNSYVTEAFAPGRLISTPHDTAYVRNPRALRTLFEKDSIMVIKNGFSTTLDDTITQFGASLVKISGEHHLHEFHYAFYKVEQRYKRYYPYQDFNLKGGEKRGDAIYFSPANKDPDEFAFYGPMCTLPPGKYKVCFDVDYQPTEKDRNYLDILGSRNHKQIVLGELHPLPGQKEYCIEFFIKETITLVKFRMHYYGGNTVSFRGVEVFRE